MSCADMIWKLSSKIPCLRSPKQTLTAPKLAVLPRQKPKGQGLRIAARTMQQMALLRRTPSSCRRSRAVFRILLCVRSPTGNWWSSATRFSPRWSGCSRCASGTQRQIYKWRSERPIWTTYPSMLSCSQSSICRSFSHYSRPKSV